jgi:hypothetical protein
MLQRRGFVIKKCLLIGITSAIVGESFRLCDATEIIVGTIFYRYP